MGRGEVRAPLLTELQFALLWRFATPVANVNDDQIILADPMVYKIGIAGGRKHANAGNVGLTSETRILCEQAAR